MIFGYYLYYSVDIFNWNGIEMILVMISLISLVFLELRNTEHNIFNWHKFFHI